MELIRYKPGEAVRWLESGAKDMLRDAKKKGKQIMHPQGERNIGKDLAQAAGAVMDVGKSALAELRRRQAEATEYVLGEASFEMMRPGSLRTLTYASIQGIAKDGDKYTLALERGAVTIRPHAYIVAGRVRVPVGWSRNGLEVPYEVLLDELAARCKVSITEGG
jgi:hypothetical protein